MKRVGAKPGNQWERISWDEAAKTVAQHMIDMRDKTGKHGLLDVYKRQLGNYVCADGERRRHADQHICADQLKRRGA